MGKFARRGCAGWLGLCLFAFSACAPVDGGDKESNTTLLVVNESEQTIRYLFVSPADSEQWGTDRLGSFNTLISGEYFSLVNLECDQSYDLKAVFILPTFQELDIIRRNVMLACDETVTWTIRGLSSESLSR